MKTTDEHRQQLMAELIEQSAEIDRLVAKSRQAADMKLSIDQELEALRAKQRETTKKLKVLEEPSRNAWENIGDGG
jgi:ABC-type enterochelin transport system substrate-binding protein